MMKFFFLLPLLLTASALASDTLESSISPVPSEHVLASDEPTVATLRAIEQEIDLLKAQQARQDAQNALEESRMKGQTLKNRPDILLPSASLGVGRGAVSKDAGVSMAVTVARLKEIWSENRTLRAAAEFNGRRIVLQPGDMWPGSEHRVKGITSRGVELSNGQVIQTGSAQ